MQSIAFKELRLFLSSPIGYLTLGLFLVLNALLFWMFDNPYNVLKAGFGDLTLFFEGTPRLLMLLIPALCMRSFSEEIRTGTLELLLTKPLTTFQIVAGKFWGVFLLVAIALLPTVLNPIAIQNLLAPEAVFDWGSVIGSYAGLFLLSATFIALCLCTSISMKSQVSALLTGLLLCFLQYDGWQLLATVAQTSTAYDFLLHIGMKKHYFSMSRGVFTFEDTAYFTISTLFFMYCCMELLKKRQHGL